MKEKLPKATHEGELNLGEKILNCSVLEDGTRIISRNAIFRAFGRTKRGRARHETREPNMPSFIDAKNLNPLINQELRGVLMLKEYEALNGKNSTGYEAIIIPLLCDVYLEARKENILTKSQLPLALASEILVRGLSKIGIIALVDEATGYQDIRVQNALEKILNEFLLKEKKPYIGMFPLDFYKQIYKLNNWQWMPENARKRPGVIGNWTNDVIYNRIAPKLLSELQKRNPTIKPGRRKFKHFQLLTDEVGDPALKSHFDGIMALMRASPNWRKFKELLNRAYPKYGDTIPIDFGLE